MPVGISTAKITTIVLHSCKTCTCIYRVLLLKCTKFMLHTSVNQPKMTTHFNAGSNILITATIFMLTSLPTGFTTLSPRLYRGPLDDDNKPISPFVLEKYEELRNNITSKDRSLLSCMEDQTYSAINDFVNCHMLCPLCSQGYGKCEHVRDGKMRICICDCNFPNLEMLLPGYDECPLIRKWCIRAVDSPKQAIKLTRCQEECEAKGFRDAALCGADLDDPPIVRNTCTCLCP